MADMLMRAVVTIPLDSGVPEDAITNTWYFDGDDSDEGVETYTSTVRTALANFYQAVDGIIFPSTVDTTAALKVYDMRDPEPRLPIRTTTFTIAPSADPALPSEVAVCLSFQATPVSGIPQARRRGRVYLGPLATSVLDNIGSQGRPGATALDAIRDAADTLAGGYPLPVLGSVKWAVYSPTTDASSSIDDAFNDVTSGWVDDSFDTQRRRGPVATTRYTFTA